MWKLGFLLLSVIRYFRFWIGGAVVQTIGTCVCIPS
jgi:hypothetical protein